MTLLDMYRWSPETMSAMNNFNYGFIVGNNLTNFMLTLFSLTECQYNEPPLFQQMLDNFMRVHEVQIRQMVDSYNSIEEVNIGTYGYTRTIGTVGKNSGSGNSHSDSENRVSAFDSDGYSPDSNNSGSAYSESQSEYNENKNENYTEKEKGKDTLETLEHKIALAQNNVYLKIADWFSDELLICVW